MTEIVSIIIPTYNRADLIGKTLNSIKSQTYANWECLVIDDHSSDHTQSIVDSFVTSDGRFKYYLNERVQGAAVARNYGLSKASGDLIVFFDSDDIMLPERISNQVQAIITEESDCCACGIYFNTIGGRKYIPRINENRDYILSLISWQIMGSTQSWMYKKKNLIDINGYDTQLQCYQDWDLTFRYMTRIGKLSIVNEALTVFINDEREDRITNLVKQENRLKNIEIYFLKVLDWYLKNRNDMELYNIISFSYTHQIIIKYYKLDLIVLAFKSYINFIKRLNVIPYKERFIKKARLNTDLFKGLIKK